MRNDPLIGVIAREMNRLGYGLHESHAESILCAMRASQAEMEPLSEVVVLRSAVQELEGMRDARVSAKIDVQMASMPVERCYGVRAKMIIAFNEAKKAGGDLDDALDAAYKSALRYSPSG